jgi:membrane protein YdbS with pleckstrin-like domain
LGDFCIANAFFWNYQRYIAISLEDLQDEQCGAESDSRCIFPSGGNTGNSNVYFRYCIHFLKYECRNPKSETISNLKILSSDFEHLKFVLWDLFRISCFEFRISMITLHPGEEILAKHHKHWFVLVAQTLPLAFLLIAPLVFIPLSNALSLPVDRALGQIPDFLRHDVLLWFAGAAWFLLIWIFFFVKWTDYYLDVWLATNKRIIDIEQKGFFNREVTECSYERVQDVTVEIRGIIASLLNFGEVHVQTAGADREIIIKGVSRPNRLRDFISREHDQVLNKRHLEWQETSTMRERARQL